MFGKVGTSTMNAFETASGKLVGFKIVNLGDSKKKYYVSEIYELGEDEKLIGSISVDSGVDFCGGLFDSGCVSDRFPLDDKANFFIIDY